MVNIRCKCGKIVCQLEDVPELPRTEESTGSAPGPGVVILCRHCKSYVVLRVPVVTAIQNRIPANTPARI